MAQPRPHQSRPLTVMSRLVTSGPARVFATLPRAHRGLSVAWWALIITRAVVPSALAVLTGSVVGAVAAGATPRGPLIALAACFVVWQILPQLHTAVSQNLGHQVSALLNDRLATATTGPPGIGHLEDPDLSRDLTTARDFDKGMSGPPMYLTIDFVAGSLTQLLVGVVAAITLLPYAWWAALLLVAAWSATHWMLRESGVWKDRNTAPVALARQHADYAYTLATDPAPAKELRLFGLQDWLLERFGRRRQELYDLQYTATRLRERSMAGAAAVVLAANLIVFGVWAAQAIASWRTGSGLGLDHLVIMVQLAATIQFVAFGGLNWAMDDASGPVLAVERLEPAMVTAGAVRSGVRPPPTARGLGVQIRDLHFRYPRTTRPVYASLDLDVPAGGSLAIVGANGIGKTTLAKLLCRCYDVDSGEIRVDGEDLADLDVAAWRGRMTAVFQDLLRLEASLRDNVDPGRQADDEQVRRALADAGAAGLADLDTPLAKGYPGGVDLSGGQWQRIALARALCAVRRGAGLVLLDEPTANLDVRGEATIFARLLAETRGATTILISHRFSTVRMASRIAVLDEPEPGAGARVIELGSHDELMARDGRYRRMYQLQAHRFDESDEQGQSYDTL